jgi:hypothetical protein
MKKQVLILFLLTAHVVADAKQCESLFKHGQESFEISILSKKSTLPVFSELKSQVLDQDRFIEIYIILESIKESGLEELTTEDRQKLIQFRQDISFLRSTYETLSKDHKSPKKFDAFVKVFGKLKDLILMNESDKSQALAALIVQNFDMTDFAKLIVEKPLADKKSIKTYIKGKKIEIKKILSRRTTVDQIHTVRKSMRNLYRYLLIQRDLLVLDEAQAVQFKYQLKYLKQINEELGIICDTNASLILDGQIKKSFPYKLELSLMQRIEHFIATVSVDFAEPATVITKDTYE